MYIFKLSKRICNSKFKINIWKVWKFESSLFLFFLFYLYIFQMIQLNGSILGFILMLLTLFLILYTNINQMERFQNKNNIDDTEDWFLI